MHRVEKPAHSPGLCAVTALSADPQGFVDTGIHLTGIDPRVYVSHQGCLALGREAGMVEDSVHGELIERLELADETVRDLEVQLDQAQKALDAIHVIEGRGFKPKKKPGRKPGQPVEA